MELRHIYSLATKISEAFTMDEMSGSNQGDVDIVVRVSPVTLYGIDKEFYRLMNGSDDGFVHRKRIEAKIDNVNFVLVEKETGAE